MLETKKFPVRVLLTVTTGRLLTKGKSDCDNGVSDLYELLGWMTDNLMYTHQLGMFSAKCKPHLLAWFPELYEVQTAESLSRLDELIKFANIGGKEEVAVVIDAWLGHMITENGLRVDYDVPRIPKEVVKIQPPTYYVKQLDGSYSVAVPQPGIFK